MEITHDVTIDLLRPRQNVIRVVQEDSTRTIRLKLLSNNQNYNVANDLDEGETLLKFVEFRKADGHGGMYDTTSTGETAVELEDQSVPNVWLVNLDGQCFTAPGWTQINVRFETESGKRIHTFRIMVDVEPTASSDTESTDWGELNSIADLRNAVSAMFEETVSVEAKQALLNLLAHVAYTDEHGQDYYDELEAELFRTAGLVSISAVFDQGSATIYDTDDLETLRQYLTVTATYEDLSTREITDYTLSGTLTDGTSTVTVSYGGKTTTFTVTVTASGVYGYDVIGSPAISGNILTPGDSGMIRTTRVFSPGNSSWKVRVGFTIGAIPTSSDIQDFIGSVDASGTSQRGALMEGAYFPNFAKYLMQGYLSSNGTAWDIAAGTITVEILPNTTNLAEIEFTGTKYAIRISSDGGETWSPVITTGNYKNVMDSTAETKGGYYIGVGLRRNGYFVGTIDLSKVQVWVDGDLWWQPIR